ncbi:hypothetical protein [Salinisphaera japonica]|uniref:Bacteriophage tail tape measure N-terminal domain-containing protein n=1 Tax=Salinisphaera japonica YTM-1 TaxID=1209778 RepID=A0A423Q1E0_9GAMM|nr:hypothetical protein [Salinisphaera japonica]ROO31974.1 hypothetical protein SAJA_02030 [Salinisphaera japonica YTM-1]
MARQYKTGLVITGDAKGGIRAIRATESEIAKLDAASARSAARQRRTATVAARGYRNLTSTIARTSAAIGALGAGAAVGGLISLTARQAEAAREADNLARTLGTTAGEVQAFQYAAEQAGIGADKASDIFKDLADKIGDAALTGGGEMAEVLDRIGVSADQLQRQNPTQQLETIGQAIQGLPRAQQVNVLESIADDGARLLPLLDNGAAALREYTDQARRFGISLSAVDNARLVEANQNMQELRGLATGVSNQFAIAMSPAIDQAAGHADEMAAIFRDEDFKNGVATIASGMGSIATSAARSVSEVGKLADAISGFDIGGIASFAASRTGPGYLYDRLFGDEDDAGVRDKPVPAGPTSQTTITANAPRRGVTQGAPSLLADYDKTHRKLEQLQQDRRKLQAAMADDPAHVAAYRRAIAEVDSQIIKLSQSNKKATATLTEQQRAANQLTSAFESERDSLQRRIALYDENSLAAQTAYDVEQGGLKGISAERQIQLTQMAQQLDMLDRQRDAVATLYPEWQRLEQIKQTRAAANDLPEGLQAAGQARAGQMAQSMATQGLPGMSGLDPQYNGAFGEANRLGDERDQFEQAYQRRREAFQEYARQHQEDKANANAAIEALDQAHNNRILQYDQQIGRARIAGSAQTFSSLADLSRTFAGEQSGIYQGLFAASKAFSVANSVLATYDAISGAFKSSLPFPANLAAAATAAAQATSMLSGVGSVAMASTGGLAGQAHDGIDSVPNTGTWNLEKGERVVDARMNRDLTRYLNQQTTNNTTNQGARSIHVTNHVTVQSSPGQSQEQARQQGIEAGRALTTKIKSVLVDEKRAGGILAR